uniref:tRNA (guanine(10)-N(2))-methyltransferase TRMT11 n=1 Tax=Neolamprologus brichardi TaxID=32507 RepID=A0A3Q4H9Q4_NEOBR
MAAFSSRSCLQYLLHLAQDNLDFRLPSPFWCLDGLSEEDVRSIMARSVCAKSAFELWGHGQTLSELRTSLLNFPSEIMSPFMHKDSTYRINVYTFNKTLLFADRIKRIDALEYLPFEGTVSLKNPQHIFCLLEDYGTDPNNIPEDPNYIYFGRWIADGQRDLIRSHSVKNRHFIGNTSMDAGLSFIMANHARVKQDDLVFDPFVGTGSLLVACSHFGAYVCGTDIDYNTIHGKGRSSRKNQKWRGPDENIRANLRQYGIQKMYVDVMVSDASKPVWRDAALFDAIVTDPPYGIREATRRTGSHKDIAKPAEGVFEESHVPVSQAYHLSDIFTDLLNFSAHHLVMGGRLVYWLPVYRPELSALFPHAASFLLTIISNQVQHSNLCVSFQEFDSLAHLSDPRFSAYQGHNAFREKYFSGLNKKSTKENNKSDVTEEEPL